MTYRIGTRGSKLALVQAGFVKNRLAAAYPEDAFDLVIIRTKGDVVTDRPIAAIGDSALFTREIETALLDGRIDLAVHSMKDLAAECPPGLVLAKAWTREDPRDVLICRNRACTSLADLPQGAVVATGSVRRDALLRRLRPDLTITGLRGNVDTRLRKLFEPQDGEPKLDAIVLAAAGLHRLGRTDVISAYLDPSVMIPAPNQGQLAIELRATDAELKSKIDALGDDVAEAIAFAERAFLVETGADCHRAVGALVTLDEGRLSLSGVDGTRAEDLAFVRREPGLVTLVGAGPGDPGLITVKGLAALRSAEVVVYDRLANEALLDETKSACVRISVGKASGNHTLPQDEINRLLAREAWKGRNVVRLKGGDPFVFGRGGEELAYLQALRIPCAVIPGVTSAVAAAASVGIPVTHRGVAQGFEVVTAHARGDEGLTESDFKRLAEVRRTVVFLMGLSRVGEIASSLIAAGRLSSTPAAVVGSATLPEEQCVIGTLADIAERAAAGEVRSPAVLIVGEVVNERRKLGFPLSGRRYLVPVIEGGSSRLAEEVRRLGGAVDEITVGRIVKIEGAVSERDLENIDRIVLTSRNGEGGLDARLRALAESRGIRIERVRDVKGDGRTLHLTQPEAERVEGVRSIDVYRNEAVAVEGVIDLSRYDGALFTCASSVRRIFAQTTGTTRAYAIGPKTAEALASAGVSEVVTAAEPTVSSLLQTLL